MGNKTLHLTDAEAVTLSMLALVGATAFDSRSPLAGEQRRRFERKFSVTITDADIVSVINKARNLVTIGGDEDVVIGDENDNDNDD